MNKTRLNYWLDVVIAAAFVMASVTGIAFLLMGSGGFQGGRNPGFATDWLGISRDVWSDLHTLNSLVMMAGVGVHLVLHWNWITCMSKRILPSLPRRHTREETCEVA